MEADKANYIFENAFISHARGMEGGVSLNRLAFQFISHARGMEVLPVPLIYCLRFISHARGMEVCISLRHLVPTFISHARGMEAPAFHSKRVQVFISHARGMEVVISRKTLFEINDLRHFKQVNHTFKLLKISKRKYLLKSITY